MIKPDRKGGAVMAVVQPALTPDRPAPPAHLSASTAEWWNDVVRDYDLEAHHLRLLQSACEVWDRMQEAREALAAHGSLTFVKASGDLQTHPAVAIERDARVGFARLVRELDLDAGAPSEVRRPPAITSNRRNG